MTIRVRAANFDDADALGEFHVQAWRDAYRGLMPDEFLGGLDPIDRAERWRQILSNPQPRGAVHVAVDGARIVGMASYGANRDPGSSADLGELLSMYAAADYWGRGVGPALHDIAIAGLADHGFSDAVLWVLDGNARAIAFYEREGWRADGATKTEPVWSITLDHVRYRRPIRGG